MGTCIPTHALLSALARRVEREGYVPLESDLTSLLALGIPAEEIAATLGASDTEASRGALAALAGVVARRGSPIVLAPDGLPTNVDDSVIVAARENFTRHDWVKLKGFFSPTLLDLVEQEMPDSGFAPKSHGELGSELCLTPCALTERLMHLMNDPRLFDVVDRITGCGTIGCFEGRIYRLVPGTDHRDAWHTDMVMGRMVAMSVNLSGERYEGGELAIRSVRTGSLLASVPNLGLGDAVLFRLSHELEHRVSDMRGAAPKTAYAGWFRMRPAFADIVAGRASF